MALIYLCQLDRKVFFYLTYIVLALLHSVINIDAAGSNTTTIGHCLFYGDKHVECRGRLRCKPSDFQSDDYTSGSGAGDLTLPELEQICPGVDEFANGTWSSSQGIIPAEYTAVNQKTQIIAKCYFLTKGAFNCVGGAIWPDIFWEGKYSGSLNSAFELGLDKWYFRHVQLLTTPTTTTTTTPTTSTSTTTPRTPTRSRWLTGSQDSIDRERQEDRWRDDSHAEDNGEIDENSFPARQRQSSKTQPTGSDSSEIRDLQQVSGTRDDVNRYDAQRLAEQDGDSNSEQTSMTFTVAPRRVFVCEYHNNGQVGCRNCTEKVLRIILETGENGNRRDYNCTQPRSGPVLKRWNADNGIIPMSPVTDAKVRVVVATCIFDKSAQTYECHGESALCPTNTGNRVHTNKCLGGKRWSGDYTGDFGYLT